MPDEQRKVKAKNLSIDGLTAHALDLLNITNQLPDVEAALYTRGAGLATLALLGEVQKLRLAVERSGEKGND